MKSHVLAALLTVCSLSLAAQKRFAVNAGWGSVYAYRAVFTDNAYFKEIKDKEDPKYSNRFFIEGSLALKRHLLLQTGINYCDLGHTMTLESFTDPYGNAGVYKSTAYLRYLSIPVKAGYTLTADPQKHWNVFALGGLSNSILVNAEESTNLKRNNQPDLGSTYSIKDDFNVYSLWGTIDVGAAFRPGRLGFMAYLQSQYSLFSSTKDKNSVGSEHLYSFSLNFGLSYSVTPE